MSLSTFRVILGLAAIIATVLLLLSIVTKDTTMLHIVRLVGLPIWAIQLLSLSVK